MEKIPSIIHESWHEHLLPLFNDPKLINFNKTVLTQQRFLPEPQDIFKVFRMPLHEIKVVLLGQDPYPQKGQATGLAFAVNPDVNAPFSLLTVYKEIQQERIDDPNFEVHDSFTTNPNQWKTLEHWEQQGVFLLNSALTVKEGVPGSHTEYWEDFITRVIHIIATEVKPIWLLWGAKARQLAWEVYAHHEENRKVGSRPNRTMLCGHPAAEYHKNGKGSFYGCNHFKKVNDLLSLSNEQTINW